jgi:hypothetical protein
VGSSAGSASAFGLDGSVFESQEGVGDVSLIATL